HQSRQTLGRLRRAVQLLVKCGKLLHINLRRIATSAPTHHDCVTPEHVRVSFDGIDQPLRMASRPPPPPSSSAGQ
ncbi:MAG: hypothetical protein ACK6EB_27985, partial [Planctomyces sp.]